MKTPTLHVQVQSHTERNSSDPLAVYQSAVEALGSERVFILESLSGPSRDRKASIVGMDPLFNIHVYQGYAKLSGQPELCAFLLDHLTQREFELGEAGFIRLADSESVWHLLRCLREPFQVPRRASPSLAYFGYLSYDSIRFVENIPDRAEDSHGHPIIALTLYQTLVYFHANGLVETLINNASIKETKTDDSTRDKATFGDAGLWPTKTLQDYEAFLDRRDAQADQGNAYPTEFEVTDSVDQSQFLGWVDKALHHIRIGDIYQIQLGHEVRVKSEVRPFDVYRALRRNNPSPYMYLAHLAGIDLIGASPELFVRLKDELIEMRPIAGTVGKRAGLDPHELILSMTRSEKERAEHVMLVDLCRNDIGRVCQPGSLEVDELMLVEEYSHLFHMVSNVRGLLRKGYDAFDVIKASFPAGTMTGAPKVRAMELIESMERNRRGIYAGAVGLIGFDDSINTALCIRSAVHQQGVYYLRASAGVVADSDPDKEWMETFYKMSSVYRAVTGQEMIQ